MTPKLTQGHRIYPNEKGEIILRAGDYIKAPKAGYWVVKTPNGIVASIMNHKVIEHDDGTITVSPSVVTESVEYKDQFMMIREERIIGSDYVYDVHWHGYLEKGVWREA